MSESAVQWNAVWRDCPLCGSARRVLLGQRGGRAHVRALGVETSVVRCVDCHGVYQRPVLLPDGNPYVAVPVDEYFAQHDSERKVVAGRGLAREAERLLGRTGRLLELGCGRGDLLRGAASVGWSVQGVELTAPFVPTIRDLDVEIAPLGTCQSLEQKHDVILLPAILEHLYDPIACLRRCATALEPDGLLFIDVPNECGLWACVGRWYHRLRGRSWSVNLSPTFPPFHVVGFCPKSLRRALAQTGFEVLLLRTDRWEVPNEGGSRIKDLLTRCVLTVGQAFGSGMGITCWARRRQHI